ncbi:MAG: PaaI family thioesterase [bacterium]|nr:PaaI family thioesterase [bacterium]
MEQKSFSECFGCGKDNTSGLKASFRNMENGDVEGFFTPDRHHSGYEDAIHVGVIVAFLDELMGRLAFVKDKYYLTQSIDVTFKCAVSYGVRLRGQAAMKRHIGRHFTARGTVFGPEGEIIAQAQGRFLQLDTPEVKRRVAGEGNK